MKKHAEIGVIACGVKTIPPQDNYKEEYKLSHSPNDDGSP